MTRAVAAAPGSGWPVQLVSAGQRRLGGPPRRTASKPGNSPGPEPAADGYPGYQGRLELVQWVSVSRSSIWLTCRGGVANVA